jgi:serine/threonine-protein kinase
LHAAHELTDDSGAPLHVVHRDFSPQNILVGVDGVTRLTDFGIAKGAGRTQSTASGAIKGKVSYMPPEQVMAKPLDRRTDVWAAGVVAWEMLAGRRLYQADDQVTIMMTIVNTPPPALSAARRGLPAELSEVIGGALRLHREERYATADEFRKRLLAAWRAHEGIAEPEEVAAFVRRMTEDLLLKRREQISRVRKARSGEAMAPDSRSGTRSAAGSAIALTPRSVHLDPSANTDQSSAWGRSIRGRRRFGLPLIVLGLIAVGLGAATLWRVSRPNSSPTASTAPVATGAPSLAPPSPEPSATTTIPSAHTSEPEAPTVSAPPKPAVAPAPARAKPRSRPDRSKAFPSLAPPDYK